MSELCHQSFRERRFANAWQARKPHNRSVRPLPRIVLRRHRASFCAHATRSPLTALRSHFISNRMDGPRGDRESLQYRPTHSTRSQCWGSSRRLPLLPDLFAL